MASATWTFVLCDTNGSELTELTTASGKNIAFARNHFAQAEFTVSHADEAASLLLDNLTNTPGWPRGIPQLKCYRRGPTESSSVLRFAGHLAPFQEVVEEQATITAVFRSPFALLLGDTTGEGRFTDASVTYTATDAGAIAEALIDLANAQGNTGLATTGTVETTKARDRTYTFANIGEAIINLTNVQNGFDFDETFVDLGTTLAQFNIYASQGADKPDSRFEYGPDTLRNVRSVTRTTRGPINSVRVLGGNGLVSTASSAASIGRYGLRTFQESATEITVQDTLDDRAQALLRPNPIKALTFLPELGLSSCPRPWEDWWIGDSVRFFARHGALLEDTVLRVNGARIAIDDNGLEAAEIQDPRTSEEDAAIRSSVAVEIASTEILT